MSALTFWGDNAVGNGIRELVDVMSLSCWIAHKNVHGYDLDHDWIRCGGGINLCIAWWAFDA